MMNTPAPADYLVSLQERGVTLWIDNGQLHYRAEKGALNAQELARLRVMKDQLVTELVKLSGADGEQSQPEERAPSGLVPLSIQQEWLLTLMERHGEWPQVQSFAFRMTGALDARALEGSVNALLQRHDVLRAKVVNTRDLRGLEIGTPRRFRLEVIPVVRDSFAAHEEDDIRREISVIAQSMDAAAGSMLLARLLKISDRQHYLILVVHRLAADCLAIAQVFRELWLLYGEELRAQPPLLLAQPMEYRDYAISQLAADAQWQQKHGAYWQEHLANASAVQWPTDGDTACVGAGEMGLLQGSFGSTLSAGLRELARQTQILPALVVLTLYVSVVSRWCGQRDFVVPFNVAGRKAAHDSAVGCFSHIMYLRVRFDGDPLFPDLLRMVSNVFYKAVLHQDCGRMALQRPELLGGTFCQWLSWHPAEISGPELYKIPGRLGVEAVPVRFQSALDLANVPQEVTDVDISFFEKAGDIGVLLIFPKSRFANHTMERFMQELRITAEGIVSAPRRPLE